MDDGDSIVTLREEKDGYIFVELNAVLQKYLGRASEKLAHRICKIVELILDAAYNYEYILRDKSEYGCSHIAGKKRIKRYDRHLFVEICEIFDKYFHISTQPSGWTICEIIKMILEMHGYKENTIPKE
jgi:hypothetical protein